MNKIKLFMSEEDYCKGFKFKMNKLGFKEKSAAVLMLVLGIAIAVLTAVLRLDYMAYTISALYLLMAVMMFTAPIKKNISREYQMSPFTKKERTILFDDYKICFISAFEKVDMAFEDICGYEIKSDCIIIQPIASSEFYVIDRSKYQSGELDMLCSLLKSKCKERNFDKSIETADSEIIINTQSDADTAVPFSFEIAVDDKDNLENQKLAVKRNGSILISYLFVIFYIAFGVYTYISSKDIKVLITIGMIAAAMAILAVYNNFILIRLMAKRINKIDKFGALKRNISVCSSYIETKVISKEHNIEIDRVIPYGYISLVTETENYFSILAGSEMHIFIPKRYLTAQQAGKLTEILRSKCQYIKTR